MLETKASTKEKKKIVKEENRSANNAGFARHSRKKEEKKKRFFSRAVRIDIQTLQTPRIALVLFLYAALVGQLANRLFLLHVTACRCLYFFAAVFFFSVFLHVATIWVFRL